MATFDYPNHYIKRRYISKREPYWQTASRAMRPTLSLIVMRENQHPHISPAAND